MALNRIAAAVAVSLPVVLLSPAQATTFLSAPESTGEVGIPASKTFTFTAAGGSGLVAFNLEAYFSVDGYAPGWYFANDALRVDLNGTNLLDGSYSLGGYAFATDMTNFIVPGGTFTVHSDGQFAGGSGVGSLPVTLANGLNTLTFSYSGVDEGLENEGWGLNNVVVTDAVPAGVVPEPSIWSLLLVGFGTAGMMVRNRRKPLTARSV